MNNAVFSLFVGVLVVFASKIGEVDWMLWAKGDLAATMAGLSIGAMMVGASLYFFRYNQRAIKISQKVKEEASKKKQLLRALYVSSVLSLWVAGVLMVRPDVIGAEDKYMKDYVVSVFEFLKNNGNSHLASRRPDEFFDSAFELTPGQRNWTYRWANLKAEMSGSDAQIFNSPVLSAELRKIDDEKERSLRAASAQMGLWILAPFVFLSFLYMWMKTWRMWR